MEEGIGRLRAASRQLVVAGLVAAAALVVAVPAQADTTKEVYPRGGSDFNDGPQGWQSAATSCFTLCRTSNSYERARGNPGGAIATNLRVIANASTLFRGRGVYLSPTFRVPGKRKAGRVEGATFTYDRRLVRGRLADLAPLSDVKIKLVDLTGGSGGMLVRERVIGGGPYRTNRVLVPRELLRRGHSYRLKIVTNMTTTIVAVGSGRARTLFDNVGLAVKFEPRN